MYNAYINKIGGYFLPGLHENLENEVLVFYLVGQVIDTNPNHFEL